MRCALTLCPTLRAAVAEVQTRDWVHDFRQLLAEGLPGPLELFEFLVEFDAYNAANPHSNNFEANVVGMCDAFWEHFHCRCDDQLSPVFWLHFLCKMMEYWLGFLQNANGVSSIKRAIAIAWTRLGTKADVADVSKHDAKLLLFRRHWAALESIVSIMGLCRVGL